MATRTDQPDATLTAKFNPLYRPYLVITIGFTMAASIVGIPLAIIWFCGVGAWWARHYFDKLSCTLDSKALRFRKGIFIQVEKTIPLENIQDVTFIEGPLLRKFNLATLKFETAGHSAGQAHDMHLTGIIDAHDFRNRILENREALRQQHRAPLVSPSVGVLAAAGHDAGSATGSAASTASAAPSHDAHLAILTKISAQLDTIAEALQRKP
ncbi:MAG: PH domain-containing protein [Phycisphaerales bacterium]|nr:PH domain-containing protein [Phycisphaerales bacterium]